MSLQRKEAEQVSQRLEEFPGSRFLDCKALQKRADRIENPNSIPQPDPCAVPSSHYPMTLPKPVAIPQDQPATLRIVHFPAQQL